MAVGLAQDLEEVVHGLVALDLALRPSSSCGTWASVPLRHCHAQALLHGLWVKARAVRHLDSAGGTDQGDGRFRRATTRIVVGVAVVARVRIARRGQQQRGSL